MDQVNLDACFVCGEPIYAHAQNCIDAELTRLTFDASSVADCIACKRTQCVMLNDQSNFECCKCRQQFKLLPKLQHSEEWRHVLYFKSGNATFPVRIMKKGKGKFTFDGHFNRMFLLSHAINLIFPTNAVDPNETKPQVFLPPSI